MNREFAEKYLPLTLQTSRAGFFGAMVSKDGTSVLRRAYTLFAEQLGKTAPPEQVNQMEASLFKEAEHVVVLIQFPPPRVIADPLMAAIVLGPLPGESFTQEVIESAAVSYYILSQDKAGTQILQQQGERFIVVGPGPRDDLGRFVEWVVRSFSDAGNVTDVPSDDPAMEAAILHARETLPAITARFAAGELENFTVKVLVEVDEKKEHFWLSDTKYSEGEFSGTIDEPGHVIEQIVPGTFIEAPMEQVTDWMYVENGKMVGNHTLRAMLSHMPPLQREKYAQHLAGYIAPEKKLPPPLPPSPPGLPKAPAFSYERSLGGWPDLKILRKRCRQIVGTRSLLTGLYSKMHYGYFHYASLYIYGKWKKEDVSEGLAALKNRGLRNPFLRDGYRALSWNGEILLGHPIIANTALREETSDGLAVPGLILGCLDKEEKTQAQAASLALRLGEIYTLGAETASDQPLEDLVRDDTYQRWRRRVVPPEFTNGVRMELFDVLLFPGQLPPGYGPIPFLIRKARPGKRAAILHIPWDCVKVIAQHYRG